MFALILPEALFCIVAYIHVKQIYIRFMVIFSLVRKTIWSRLNVQKSMITCGTDQVRQYPVKGIGNTAQVVARGYRLLVHPPAQGIYADRCTPDLPRHQVRLSPPGHRAPRNKTIRLGGCCAGREVSECTCANSFTDEVGHNQDPFQTEFGVVFLQKPDGYLTPLTVRQDEERSSPVIMLQVVLKSGFDIGIRYVKRFLSGRLGIEISPQAGLPVVWRVDSTDIVQTAGLGSQQEIRHISPIARLIYGRVIRKERGVDRRIDVEDIRIRSGLAILQV